LWFFAGAVATILFQVGAVGALVNQIQMEIPVFLQDVGRFVNELALMGAPA
jgi:hypothetical protein